MRQIALFLIIPILALSGCYTAPPKPKPISFTQFQPIYVDVASVDVSEEYQSPLAEPNLEHLFPTSPAEAMKAWVRDRLKLVGGERELQVIIRDASVKRAELPTTKGIKGAFTNDQAERLDARLEVEMRIYGKKGAMSEASINVVATRSDTVPENASVATRDMIYDRMVRDLMEVLNAEMERNFHQYFSNYASYTHDVN